MSSRPRKPYFENNDEIVLSLSGLELLASRPPDSARIKDVSIFLVDSSGWKDITDIVKNEIRKTASFQLDFIKSQRESLIMKGE